MITFDHTIPILRMFDVDKAKEFYIGFLGLNLDWEHRFEDNMPVYMQVSRAGLVLHLSEHHGDGTPGTVIFVRMRGVEEFHREVSAKNYKYLRPGVEDQRPDLPFKVMNVIDPFGNRIRFAEGVADPERSEGSPSA
ncbi:MAG TPA: glyoxalase superfamily protein [Thermoanaerobaculia bacterium]|nr:glyoxalase superfamily protein [Thermoanaerobaculia bacterium]